MNSRNPQLIAYVEISLDGATLLQSRITHYKSHATKFKDKWEVAFNTYRGQLVRTGATSRAIPRVLADSLMEMLQHHIDTYDYIKDEDLACVQHLKAATPKIYTNDSVDALQSLYKVFQNVTETFNTKGSGKIPKFT